MHSRHPNPLLLSLLLGFSLFLNGCQTPGRPAREHAIIGSWIAQDSTVFSFRADGTFVGRDYVGRLIWGNWVAINDEKVGFQSLFYADDYLPQFALVSGGKMRYTTTPEMGFIACEPLTPEVAKKAIESAR